MMADNQTEPPENPELLEGSTMDVVAAALLTLRAAQQRHDQTLHALMALLITRTTSLYRLVLVLVVGVAAWGILWTIQFSLLARQYAAQTEQVQKFELVILDKQADLLRALFRERY